MPRIFEDWEKAQYQPSTPAVAKTVDAEKARIAQASAYAGAVAEQPLIINVPSRYAEESGVLGARGIDRQIASAAQDLTKPTVTQGVFDPAAARMGEEASMGAPKPPTTVVSTPPTVDAKPDEPDTTPPPSSFTPRGTLIRYRVTRPGYRVPIYADGKGGEYEGPEEKYESDSSGDKNTQFVEWEYNKDFTKRRAKYFNSSTGQFTYGDWEDNPMTAEQYAAQQAAAAAAAAAQQQKADAFALIEATIRSYGFSESEMQEIGQFIRDGLMNPQMGPNQLLLAMRQLASYKARFQGNEVRRAMGLNALSEAQYLAQEQDYGATFRQRGLQRFATREQFANLIGNDISNTELGKRVDLAVQRVSYGDPAVLKQLRTYYNITEQDIAAYYLSPKEVLPELEAKTTTAEIGAMASKFGLASEKERAEALRQEGVDLTRARAGYEIIAGRLPRAKQISEFYAPSNIEYGQTTAEEEEFKGTASAKRARERLTELEKGSFSGTSGRGLLAPRSSAGAF